LKCRGLILQHESAVLNYYVYIKLIQNTFNDESAITTKRCLHKATRAQQYNINISYKSWGFSSKKARNHGGTAVIVSLGR
jgi:hypothetical protein